MKKAIRSYLIGAAFLSLVPAGAGATPATVGDLVASSTTVESSVLLRWTSPDPADGNPAPSGYLVKYATSEIRGADFYSAWVSTYAQSWTPGAAGGQENRTLTGLEPGVTFYFAVSARDKDGNYGLWTSSSDTGGVFNSAAYAVAFDSAPLQTTGVSPAQANAAVRLSWTANPEIDIARYRIERSSYSSQEGFSPVTAILSPGTTHYDPGLVNGNTYYYRVRAEDRTGHIGDFSLAAGTAPWIALVIPSFTSYTAAASTSVLNWAWNPSGGALGYSVINSTSGDTMAGPFGPAATYWIQTDLLANTSCSVYVQAFNGLLIARSADRRLFTLASPPTGAYAVAASSWVALSWSGNGNSPSTRYLVRKSTDNFSSDNRLLMSLTPSTTCQDDGLLEGVTCYYRVWAYNGDDLLTSYASVSTTTPRIPPAAPAINNLNAGLNDDGEIRLVWLASGDDGSERSLCSSYTIKWSTDAYTLRDNFDSVTSSRVVAAAKTPPFTEEEQFFSLYPGTTFWFALKAKDESDNYSLLSETWSVTAPDFPPNVPTGCAAAAVSSSTVNVSWTRPLFSGYDDRDKYRIYRATFPFSSPQANVAAITVNNAASATYYIDAGLQEETTYYYRLSTLDLGDRGDGFCSSVLESSLSTPTVWTRTPDTVAPGAVSSITALSGATEGRISLAWTSPGDNGYGGDINGGRFRVDYTTDALKDFQLASYQIDRSTNTRPGDANRLDLQGLLPGSTYYLRVWTADEAGNWSALSAGATAWAQLDVTPPAAVTDLAAAPAWKRILLSWTAPGDDGTAGALNGTYEIRLSTEGPINAGNWDSMPAAHPYRISFATSAAPGAREAMPVTGLVNGTTYYVSLRARDERGTLSAVSVLCPEVTPFNLPPNPFDLQGPADDSVSNGYPVFSWQANGDPDGVYGDAVAYSLQYSTSGDFTSYTSVATGNNNYLLNLTAYEDRPLWWRVVTFDLNGASTLSSQTFRVWINDINAPPPAFDLVAPSSGSTVATAAPALSWNTSLDPDPGTAVTYQVDYSPYADFSAFTSSAGLTAASFAPPALAENATCYWRVWAFDGFRRTLCNDTWYFRVNAVVEAPAAFSLTGPADLVILSTTTVAFSWQGTYDPDPGETVTYELSWSNLPNFASSTTVAGLTSPTTTFTTFPENSVIYWHVTAVGSDGQRRSSGAARHFYIDVDKELPGGFDLVEPGYNVVISTTVTPIFSWSRSTDPDPADDVRYIIDISPNPNFTGLGTVAVDRGPDRYYIPLIGLTDQTTYYWRVRAAGYQGNPIPVQVDPGFTYSSTGVFVISMVNNPPQSFALSAPPDGAAITTKRPHFTWSTSADADVGSVVHYALVVSTSQDFSSPVLSVPDIYASEYRPASPLLENRTYYWKVTAVDNKSAQTLCANAFSFSLPVLNVPRAPSGLKGNLSADKLRFTIDWAAVEKNSDNTEIDDLAGYNVYRGLSTQKMHLYAVVPSTSIQWTDEATDGGDLYYRVRAVDSSGIESPVEDSPVITSLSADTLNLLSEDRSLNIEIPPAVTRYLLSGNNPFGSDLLIKFERNSSRENDTVLYSYRLKVQTEDGEVLDKITFTQPLTLTFGYGSGTPAAPRLAAARAAGTAAGELNVFWNNGIEFLRLGGADDAQDQQVTLKVVNPGEYQLRRVLRAPSFGVAGINPPKVFTPGIAPYEKIQFFIDNPAGDKVVGKVFDLRGEFVADLRAAGDATAVNVTLEWDGKAGDGAQARKGVYLYQVEGSGKVVNGTIMVAR